MSDSVLLGGDMKVNRLAFGAMEATTGWGMWGPPKDPQNTQKLLRTFLERGGNFIVTADSYGPGDSERAIREALSPYPDDLVLCTKGGMLRSGPTDWLHDHGHEEPYIMPLGRPEYLRQQIELSLRNLGVETIDLYELHSIDPNVPLEDQIGALVHAQDQGKIRHIGLSNQPGVTVDTLKRAQTVANIVTVENLYNVENRADEPTLQYVERQEGMAFLPWFPLGHGELVGPGGILEPIAKEAGVTPAQLALAWLLNRSDSLVPIPGTTSLDHLNDNMAAVQAVLSESELDYITKLVDASETRTWRPGT